MDQAMAARAEVAALEDERFRAMREEDWAALDRLFSPDLCYTHSSGIRDGKDAYLAAMRDGTYRYFEMTVLEREVRVFGDTALVFSRVLTRLHARGADKNLDNSTLCVWLRRDGAWRFTAYQATPMPKP